MRKLVAALGGALTGIMSDPGARPPRIKTGAVVIEPGAIREFGSIRESLSFTMPADAAVPASRVRVVRPGLEERWTAIPQNLEHLSLAELARVTSTGTIPISGWRVTYHKVQTGVDFSTMTGDEIRAHVMSLSIAPEDDATYNGYYPTIKGNDVAHHDPSKSGMAAYQGGPTLKGRATDTHDGTIRGGTEIRGGRAAYNKATKNYVPFDNGYFKHVEKIKAEQATQRQAKLEVELAKKDAKLPRKIGEL